jgi:integrase
VVGPPKSAAGTRAVTIPATLAAMLDEHLATYVKPRPDALVFTSDEGLPMHRVRWAFVWRRAAKAAGYEGLHFHDLRHHAGTLAAQLGATTKEIMDRLGHSTMRASLIYQYSTAERQRELADRMDDALKRRSTGAA